MFILFVACTKCLSQRWTLLVNPGGVFDGLPCSFFGEGKDQVVGLPRSTLSKNKIQGYKLQFLVIEVCFQVLKWELFEFFLEANRHYFGQKWEVQVTSQCFAEDS